MVNSKKIIFCDESSQTTSRYMIIGGIILPYQDADEISYEINLRKQKLGINSELKWTKVTNQKFKEYSEITDYFFSLCNNGHLQFKCIIVDNHKIDNRKYNAGDGDLGFFKFYYQLLLHSFGRNHHDNCDLHVLMDQKSTRQSLDNFRDILNKGIKKRYGVTTCPFVRIEFKDSKQTPILQINDIIIGGLAHRKNGLQHLPNCRQSKVDLSAKIIRSAGLSENIENTPKKSVQFSAWNFIMK